MLGGGQRIPSHRALDLDVAVLKNLHVRLLLLLLRLAPKDISLHWHCLGWSTTTENIVKCVIRLSWLLLHWLGWGNTTAAEDVHKCIIIIVLDRLLLDWLTHRPHTENVVKTAKLRGLRLLLLRVAACRWTSNQLI